MLRGLGQFLGGFINVHLGLGVHNPDNPRSDLKQIGVCASGIRKPLGSLTLS